MKTLISFHKVSLLNRLITCYTILRHKAAIISLGDESNFVKDVTPVQKRDLN